MYVPGHKQKNISRQPICLTDYDHDYTLEEIGCRDKIEFERDVEFFSDGKDYCHVDHDALPICRDLRDASL